MKRHNIDGLPGITMHGKKGPDGPRGGMTFCNSESSVTFENIVFDNKYSYSLGIIYSNKKYSFIPFISNCVAPIKDDYVLNVTTSYTDLYTISQEVEVFYDDIKDYLSGGEINEDGTIAPGFSEEVIIIGGEEDDTEKEEDRFIEFGDTSIGYYALIKELSAEFKNIQGFTTTKDGAFFGKDSIMMYVFDRLDTWNFLNGVPNDIDLGVSVRSIEIQRNAWNGYYSPRAITKRSHFAIGNSPFEHYKNGITIGGDDANMFNYCVDVLGYAARPLDNVGNKFELSALDDEGNFYKVMMPTICADNIGGDGKLITYSMKFVNALTGLPCANETFNLTFYFGDYHFYDFHKDGRSLITFKTTTGTDEKGNVITVVEENTEARYVEGNLVTTTTRTYGSDSLLRPDEVVVTRSKISDVFTNLEGEIQIKLWVPNGDYGEVYPAYVTVTNGVENEIADDNYLMATILLNDFTYNGNDYDFIKCNIMPKQLSKYVDDASYIDASIEIDNNYMNHLKNSIPGIGAKFVANTDEFVYIDTATPTSKGPLMSVNTDEEIFEEEESEVKMYNTEDVIEYLTNDEFCKAETKAFAFTQFVISSSLTEEEKRKIRIEAEITVDGDTFTPEVSSCLKDLWTSESYEGEEYGGGEPMTKAIQQRQEALLRDAMNNPNDYKSMYFETRTENGGFGNGKGEIYFEDGEAPERLTVPLYKKLGYIRNIDHTLNFDKEQIFPCTLVVKDYNEGVDKTEFVSTLLVPADVISSATIRIYAYYKKTSSASIKMLLGETSFGSTFDA